MEVTAKFIQEQKEKYPGCELAKLALKDKDEKTVLMETVIRSPDRKVISEAEKYENTNPGKAKEIYVRNCTLVEVEKIMADDNLFYQVFFAITDLLPFQKAEVTML